jgi:rhamnosyltransferase
MTNVAIHIPTLNAGERWPQVLDAICAQLPMIEDVIILDSGSSDDTVSLAIDRGFRVFTAPAMEFDHGGSRQQLAELSRARICVFLTQDAILAQRDSIATLINVFADERVGMAYGRQLPHAGASPLEVHARLFNYPDAAAFRSFSDRDKLGFKVIFSSNSFAAYRFNTLQAMGGFRSGNIMGEDTLAAAAMLQHGLKIAYVAGAKVYHSHHYSPVQEFRRYFDTRVFHEQNLWLFHEFGRPGSEGLRFAKSEIKFILSEKPVLILNSVLSLGAKWLGYYTGQFYRNLPSGILRHFSMHPSYWKKKIN